jgi:prevent-host-death family protein
MRQVNMHEAKTQLSRLVDAVAKGEMKEVIIAKDGEPKAKIVPIEPARKKVRLGLAKDRYPEFDMDAFNAVDEDIAKLFNGPDA